MNIHRNLIQSNGYNIPSIIIEPSESIGIVIIIHGYGGNKEEQLGLGWRISESGFTSCLIDLPGHGENDDYFEGDIKLYVDSVIDFYKKKESKIIVVGHSIGGRLSLVSKAAYVIGISPTLVKEFSEGTKGFTTNIRSYRVRQLNDDFLWSLHRQLPLFDIAEKKAALIIYGSRDIPEIIKSCKELKEKTNNVFEVDKVLHSDSYTNERVFEIIITHLKQWINK
jgi:hypothetical protein